MLTQWLAASIHLLALGVGLGAIWARSRALLGPLDSRGMRTLFGADGLWGAAAILWIGTGIWRLFGGLEKGLAYYMGNTAFLFKMALLALILALEVWPMVTLIRWRVRQHRGEDLDTTSALALARVSQLQAALVVAMVVAATAMARGFGYG